jgi:hypothetical protein
VTTTVEPSILTMQFFTTLGTSCGEAVFTGRATTATG